MLRRDRSDRRARLAAVALAIALPVILPAAGADSAPRCPDGTEPPRPAYAPVDAPPEVAAWTDLSELPPECLVSLDRTAPLAVALAGRFAHAGSIDDIAARLGAVSTTVGLPYWSVSDGEWRTLVSDAAALDGPDAADERGDFTAAEVLGGDALHFAQNDTRSWGTNVYRLRALDAGVDHLVAETENVSGIKLGPVTLFAPGAVTAVHFVRRLDGSTWGYYGLSVIRDSDFEARKKSLINRTAAFYRLLIGAAPDGEAPLAP